MKLNIVPARTGFTWVKLGCKVFFRQPLAMSGLFFLYMAVASLFSLVPVIGPVIALMIVPAATLGFMVATQEAIKGKFPMPTVLISAFRAGRDRASAMLILGALYAAACLVIALVLVPLLVDAPSPVPAGAAPDTMMSSQLALTMMVTALFYLPVSLLFWYAPGLVHWHGISPVKSLFFSLIACVRNIGALMVFGLGWLTMSLGVSLVMSLVGSVAGPNVAAALLLPLGLLLAAMVSTSIYFPFCDSFVATPAESAEGVTPSPTTPPGD